VEFLTQCLAHAKGKKGLAEKVRASIREAVRRGCDGAVVVVDRDGTGSNGAKLARMRQGREEARSAGEGVPTALGVAIETMEAWLLSDERALSEVCGATVPKQPNPEGLAGTKGSPNHPKTRLAGILFAVGEIGSNKAQVAARADLDVMEKRCPHGFKPFAEEVRRELGPLLAS
jgi:hypothetical protein